MALMVLGFCFRYLRCVIVYHIDFGAHILTLANLIYFDYTNCEAALAYKWCISYAEMTHSMMLTIKFPAKSLYWPVASVVFRLVLIYNLIFDQKIKYDSICFVINTKAISNLMNDEMKFQLISKAKQLERGSMAKLSSNWVSVGRKRIFFLMGLMNRGCFFF